MYRIAATPRPLWAGLPADLHRHIGDLLGSQVVAAGSVTTGFSNGYAGPLTLADGRRAFAKVIAGSGNPEGAELYHQEIRVTARMPATAPTPRLLDGFEVDLAGDRWVGLLLTHIDGGPPDLARPGELDRVIDLTMELAELDPCPIDGLPAMTNDAAVFDSWRGLDRGLAGLESYGEWLSENFDRLVQTAAGWPEAAAGTALLHGDLRLDNMVMTADAGYAVDWPSARIGAPWVDALLMLPALALVPHGPAPEAVVARHPLLAALDPDALDAVLVAALGYFVTRSLLPPPPALPTVRQFQRAQAEVILDWLQRRWT